MRAMQSSRSSADQAIALVSDAGTPLISEPGYKLVRAAQASGHRVDTVPGPSAAIAALTLAGLPTDRFLFLGFLPPRRRRAKTPSARSPHPCNARVVRKWPTVGRGASGAGPRLGRSRCRRCPEISKLHEECVTGSLAGPLTALCRGSAQGRDRDRRWPASKTRRLATSARCRARRGAQAPVAFARRGGGAERLGCRVNAPTPARSSAPNEPLGQRKRGHATKTSVFPVVHGHRLLPRHLFKCPAR